MCPHQAGLLALLAALAALLCAALPLAQARSVVTSGNDAALYGVQVQIHSSARMQQITYATDAAKLADLAACMSLNAIVSHDRIACCVAASL